MRAEIASKRLRAYQALPSIAAREREHQGHMRGTVRPISLARRLVINLMHASVPLVVVKRIDSGIA
jgi:hypothetical protein